MRVLLFLGMLVLAFVPAAGRADEPALRCARCNDLVKSDSFQTKGVIYHSDCFRCAQCDRAIRGPYSEYRGLNYHNECFEHNIALKCSLCDDVIRGPYLEDFWGNSYCERHTGEAPVCDSCGRFISPRITRGGVRYDDGRHVCNVCRPTSVTDVDEILLLVHDVAEHMSTFGMNVDYNGIRVHLVSRDEMQHLSGRHTDGLRGFTDYQEDFRVFGRTKNRRMQMYLLYGMPRMEIISTIAHELAHVWQFNRGRFRNDRGWTEGSCNYAAYLVLGKYPGRESAFFRASLMRDEDEVYGDGLRRVKALAESEGTRTWLRLLARNDDFPAGY